jgi:hypothetical protein
LLLTAGPASARIVYTPAYTTVPGATGSGTLPFLLDLNHDGIADFKFYELFCGSDCSLLRVSPAQAGNTILGRIQGTLGGYGLVPFTCHVGSALPAGHRIGPGSRFGAYQTMNYRYGFAPAGGPGFALRCGYWGGAQGRFLGFEFTAQGQKHFGWARLNKSVLSPGATLTGYAYETDPGKPIRAGDTGPAADARAPETHSAPPTAARLRRATLGLLALGSAGLDIWRKEQDR